MSERIDWDEIRNAARPSEEGPPDWPREVRPVNMDRLSLLGIDRHNRLYWDGKRIEINRTVSLNWWQAALAVLTALGALASGAAALLPLLGIKP